MTRTNIFWLAAIVCTVAIFGARAQNVQSPGPAPAPGTSGAPGNTGKGATTLGTLDRDGDGKLSRAEARAEPALAESFEALDRDDSGMLDSAEFARYEVGGETAPGNERSRGGATAESDSEASRDRDRTRDAPPSR